MSKRFLILSGLAGSGKTQLALAFASALVKNKDKQMCVVSVGADWTNREPLLGFPNALQPEKYVKPESGVLDLLIEANRKENADKPFFLILDEMNMSYVERYFADFLSAMESREKISLWNSNTDSDKEIDGVPQRIDLPKNLFIIGTINVDETTYMFSPKVLDRANVIEFKISSKEMGTFLQEMREIDRDSIISKAAGMVADFVAKACKKDLAHDDEAVKMLQKFFDELKNVNAEFGYRSATEIFRFICQAKANDDTGEKMTDEEILDAAIVQKLLPKLHGSRKKLEPVLAQLWKLCFTGAGKNLNIAKENVEKAQYKESADKIRRMYESATANGFTSFAEA
jgi:5-methylcytosine-specific restriction protein B